MKDAKREDLIRQRQRLLRHRPPFTEVIRGTLFERQLTCGKPYCRCARGTGHRVWYLSVSRSPAAPEQITLPAALVATVRRQVKNWRRLERWLGQLTELNRKLLRLERAAIRQAARSR